MNAFVAGLLALAWRTASTRPGPITRAARSDRRPGTTRAWGRPASSPPPCSSSQSLWPPARGTPILL